MVKSKAKFFFLVAITLFSFASLMLAIVNYNPYNSHITVFATFYISFFVTLLGLLTFVILFIKSRFSTNNVIVNVFWESVRQAALLSVIFTLLLALKGLKVLDLWVSVPLTIAIIMVEMYIRGISRKHKNA